MSRTNRVTPFGTIIATPARGQWMGNRGCLHDDQRRIVRQFQTRRWIICLLEFKGRHRPRMQPGAYTELFFLDEATALAAGHRPCAECQRPRYNAFRQAWTQANPHLTPAGLPGAEALDRALHAERVTAGREKATYQARLAQLPDGSFVTLAGQAYLVRERQLRPWSPAGYGPAQPADPALTVAVLTPSSIVRTLASGFAAQLHASAFA